MDIKRERITSSPVFFKSFPFHSFPLFCGGTRKGSHPNPNGIETHEGDDLENDSVGFCWASDASTAYDQSPVLPGLPGDSQLEGPKTVARGRRPHFYFACLFRQLAEKLLLIPYADSRNLSIINELRTRTELLATETYVIPALPAQALSHLESKPA